MNQETAKKLQQLTKNFYDTVAGQFSDTRQTAWPGWERTLVHLNETQENGQLSVLDLACGNGRFINFLKLNLKSELHYDGIDSNEVLLHKTKALLFEKEVQGNVYHIDLVDRLTEKNQMYFPELNRNYNLIVCFGIFHHIPSKELRTSCIQQLGQLLQSSGILIISLWQFANLERFQKKLLSPQSFEIDPAQLEENDYLLGWDTQINIARYCHSFSMDEIKELVAASGLKLLDQFKADGKDNNMNTYLVLQRSTQ